MLLWQLINEQIYRFILMIIHFRFELKYPDKIRKKSWNFLHD